MTRKLSLQRLRRFSPYPKQLQFFEQGKTHRERLFRAGNRLGKTISAAAEWSAHLTGRYEQLAFAWPGKIFDRPVQLAAACETSLLTRDGLQKLLIGYPAAPLGTGMIPADAIIDVIPSRHGPAGTSEMIRVAHGGGGDVQSGESICYFRSYDQGRERIQAMELDGFWLDEEPDSPYYMEALTRTNNTWGPVVLTFTPLKGATDVVRRFLSPSAGDPGASQRAVISMTIYDVCHYTDEQREAIIASYPEHERAARTMGEPSLGSGLVFPCNDADITVQAFEIPAHWPRVNGIDFGWDHPTAAVSLAWDRDNDCVYVTNTHRLSEATPAIHALTLKAWGSWVPWAWPHDGLQHDKGSGEQLSALYRTHGLSMLAERATFVDGTNGVEAGVTDMLERIQSGRLKVFAHLADWFEERRGYHRKDGKIVKLRDDLLSATRYAIMSLRHAITKPKPVTHDSSRKFNWRAGI